MIRLVALACLTMTAFAANSLLNRAAIAGGYIDVASFALIRLVAGAVMLAVLCHVLRGKLILLGPARGVGVTALLVYIFGFSAAYTTLDAGVGALILFAMVQVSMFGFAVITREATPLRRWIGASLALTGLAWLLWPDGADPVSLLHAGLMAMAGLAWGAYSLAGRHMGDALQATAANFILAVPAGALVFGVWALRDTGVPAEITGTGIALAGLAGAVTSGIGYAMWYSVLPLLSASAAAVAQLSVPVIALVAGAVFLAEPVSLRAALAAVIVLSGIALSLLPVWRGPRP